MNNIYMTDEKLRGMPREDFEAAVDAEIKRLRRKGFDRANICGRSFEIEDGVVEAYLAALPK